MFGEFEMPVSYGADRRLQNQCASFGRRSIAAAIDIALQFAVMVVIGGIYGGYLGLSYDTPNWNITAAAAGVMFWIIYKGGMEGSHWQATLAAR